MLFKVHKESFKVKGVMILFRNLIVTIVVLIGIFLFIGFSGLNIDVIDFKSVEDRETYETLEEDEAIVSRVIDGDTVLVINSDGEEERVRLLLVDTPESVHPDKPAEKFGEEASEFTKKHLKQGKKITLERGSPEKDDYGRTLGYIFIDGVNFNQLLLEEGYARIAYVYEPNTKYLNEFKKAENRAKEQKKNIWSVSGYVTEKGFDMSVVE